MFSLLSQFSFLSSFALLGLVCLAIPILIHLSRQNKTQQVIVGSIELLKKLPKQTVKQRKLSELLLLLTRLLIFLLITLWLAELVLNQQENKVVPNAIVTQAWLAHASEQEISQFIADQELIADKEPKHIKVVSADGNIKSMPFTQIRTLLAPPLPSETQTIKSLQAISKTLSNYDDESLGSNLPNIYLNDSFFKTQIAKQKLFVDVQEADAQNKQSPLPIHLNKRNNESSLNNDKAAVHIVIVFDEHRDTRFLDQALLALQNHQHKNMQITSYSTQQYLNRQSLDNQSLDNQTLNNQSKHKAHILFDLSDSLQKDDFKETLIANGLIISDLAFPDLPLADLPLTDLPNISANQVSQQSLLKQLKLNVSAQLRPFPPLAQPLKVGIFKNQPLLPSERSLWQTLSNVPILIEQSTADENLATIRQLQLNTRFEPNWFSLVKQPEFPSVLQQLFAQYGLSKADTVQLTESQIRHLLQQFTQSYRLGVPQHTPLNQFILLLLIGLFLIERLVSESSLNVALKKRPLAINERNSIEGTLNKRNEG